MASKRICLLGASLNTGNLGVSALCMSALRGVLRTLKSPQISVFGDTSGVGSFSFEADGSEHTVRQCGAYLWRRIWKKESLLNIYWSARFGGLANPGARAIAESDLVLDASGGDSFTDLYGSHRYNTVTILKRVALQKRKRLVLLPQTYGPFVSRDRAADAARLIRGAAMAWARDKASYEILRNLVGKDFDPHRHCCGVDMAFALESLPPAKDVCERIEEMFSRPEGTPIVGFNVSGLAYNDKAAAAKQYGFNGDYRKVVVGFLKGLLKESDCRVALIPHVVTESGHFESDRDACEDVAKELEKEAFAKGRVFVVPVFNDPRRIKWVIAQVDWFCGMRMHSTIAALSSGVPTAALAYSAKTLGVFKTCGQGEHVADLRALSTEEAIERLRESWNTRHEARESLREIMPNVVMQAETQFEQMLLNREMSPASA